MKRTPLFVGLVAVSLASLAHGSMGRDASLVTQLIVQPSRFHEAHASRLDANAMARFIHASGIALEHVRPMSGQAQVLRLPHPMSVDEARAHAAMLVDAGVAIRAEPDERVYPSLVPNDPFYSEQWHYHSLVTGQVYGLNNYGLNLPAAWDITTGSNGVVVAVIDTGLLPHEDIDAGRVLSGYDFITDIFTANDGNARDPDPRDPGDWVTADEVSSICQEQDSSWHGTHIAATIGAASNNGLGVTGIDWQARLLPVRVLGKCGGDISDVIDGLRWSAGLAVPGVPDAVQPARVLNMSFTGPGACGDLFQDAIDDIRSTGAVLVVAAGNASASATNYFPGNCSGVINVAATDRQGQKSYFSNTGSAVTLSAPGGGIADEEMILSAWNRGATVPAEDGYAFAAGTSMAAAHVSGVVSLMLAVNPSLGPGAVRDILRQTATPFPAYNSPDATGTNCTTSTCGAGIVRADAAVQAAIDYTPPSLDGGGGGGAAGLLTLAGLAGLAAWRRRRFPHA